MSSSGAFSMFRKNVRGAPGSSAWMSLYFGSFDRRSTSWPGVSSIAFASPGLERGHACRRIVGHDDRPLVEVRRTGVAPQRRRPVVVRVLDELDLLLRGVARELEEARADRVLRDIGAVLRDRGRREEAEADLAERVEERRLRLLEVHLDRQRIDDDRLVVLAHQARRVGRLRGRVNDPVEVELHGGRIERRAVVELHAGVQLERVDEAVRRDRPAVREIRVVLLVVGAEQVSVSMTGISAMKLDEPLATCGSSESGSKLGANLSSPPFVPAAGRGGCARARRPEGASRWEPRS